jgi:hypothetical protein
MVHRGKGTAIRKADIPAASDNHDPSHIAPPFLSPKKALTMSHSRTSEEVLAPRNASLGGESFWKERSS